MHQGPARSHLYPPPSWLSAISGLTEASTTISNNPGNIRATAGIPSSETDFFLAILSEFLRQFSFRRTFSKLNMGFYLLLRQRLKPEIKQLLASRIDTRGYQEMIKPCRLIYGGCILTERRFNDCGSVFVCL